MEWPLLTVAQWIREAAILVWVLPFRPQLFRVLPAKWMRPDFWNVVRTQCEIQQYMNCEIPATATGLIANYHFNQGIPSGTNSLAPQYIKRCCEGSNTGTLTNMALSGSTSNWISGGGVVSNFTTSTAPSVTLAAFGNSVSIPAGSSTPLFQTTPALVICAWTEPSPAEPSRFQIQVQMCFIWIPLSYPVPAPSLLAPTLHL